MIPIGAITGWLHSVVFVSAFDRTDIQAAA
jgi:hypothetical protein